MVKKVTRGFRNAERYFKTILAFILIVSALVNITFAWFDFDGENGILTRSYVTVAADGLILETEDGENIDSITLDKACDELVECSSVDGRNIFFPVSGDYSLFREASANDQNSKYICVEFTLTSDKDTNVWLSNESYVLGAASDAIRIAVDYDVNEEPCVMAAEFAPVSLDAVASIDEDGNVTSARKCELRAVSDFYYNSVLEGTTNNVIGVSNNAVMTLEAGISRRIAVTIWLEGTDPECDDTVYGKGSDDPLQICLKFTSGIKESRVLRFSDYTLETWAYIKTREEALPEYDFLLENNTFKERCEELIQRRVFVRDVQTGTMYAMAREKKYDTVTTPTSGTNVYYDWIATLPKTVTQVEFIRLDYHHAISKGEAQWEFWNTHKEIKTVSGVAYLRFFALECGSTGSSDSNRGVWTNSVAVMTIYLRDIPTQTDVFDTTMQHSVSFPYYGGSFDLHLKMSYIGVRDGTNLYATRIIAAATNQFGFRQPDGTLYLTGKYRSNKNNNLYTLSKSGSSYSGQWSVNSAYPIR